MNNVKFQKAKMKKQWTTAALENKAGQTMTGSVSKEEKQTNSSRKQRWKDNEQ